MDIVIGLPNPVRGVNRRAIVDWARRADQAGFSSASSDPAQVELARRGGGA